MNFKILLDGQEALIVLFCAFIIGGIFKTQGLFLPVFTMLSEKVKSKRLSLLFISLIAGVLPVEGRVSVSAPILDSLVHKDHSDCCGGSKARGKIGILDYIATHHYYLWSPLEKSIIILMAGLSLTYGEVLKYTAFPIFLYLIYLSLVVFIYIDEKDIIINKQEYRNYDWKNLIDVIPFVAGIILSIFYPPYYVFPVVTIYYYVITADTISLLKLFSFIKWKTLLFVFSVIVFANFAKANYAEIIKLLNIHDATFYTNPNIGIVILLIASGAFVSFILGSSGKYAGICVAITLALGIKYFPIIFMAEYCAYLLSPAHKCLAISAGYFETRVTEFYKLIGGLVLLMFASGIVEYLFIL